MAKRKVVQIATMPGLTVRGWFRDTVIAPPALYVLCSDGTVWAVGVEDKKWQPVGLRSIMERAILAQAGATLDTIGSHFATMSTLTETISNPTPARPAKAAIQKSRRSK